MTASHGRFNIVVEGIFLIVHPQPVVEVLFVVDELEEEEKEIREEEEEEIEIKEEKEKEE